jgi:hypothetical protein
MHPIGASDIKLCYSSKKKRIRSAAGRARTSDFKVFSLALSQLSYCGLAFRESGIPL